VRVLARVRPLIGLEEEAEVPCLNLPPGGTQLEVLLEPRALLTDLSRSRRRTIGGCGGSRSSAALGDPVRALGFGDATGNAVQTSTRHESRTFSFDKVFDASVTDDQVFSELEDEFTAALEGESVSILAYGATGSGKTHTVSNLAERCARMLDRRADALEQGGLRLEVMVQIVEIYNEQFRDLLTPDAASREPPRLKMAMPSSSAILQGAESRSISRDCNGGIMRSLQAALRFGQAQRATSATS
ncbi:unnamed protein product, partial [Polarella glacialis]